jgi:hypothetical protein
MNYTPAEQKQLDDEWKKLEKVLADAKVHAICGRVLAICLAEDGVTWRQDWTKDMAEGFWTLLDAENGKKDRKNTKKCVDDLIFLASFIENDLKRANLGYGLVILLNEAVIKYKLAVDVEAKFDEATAKSEDKAKAVAGAKARPVPGKVGEKAPEGTVRPDLLKGGKRRI